VIEIDADFESVLDNLVGRDPLYVHEETDSAGVMFLRRIVKALLVREIVRCVFSGHVKWLTAEEVIA
jgi:hypothetical protein|tara:strand:+ start:6252 stop:6452 length:201 start_codon:yes stop_codon:yes gene_type:complete